jgi:hypothetical protein
MLSLSRELLRLLIRLKVDGTPARGAILDIPTNPLRLVGHLVVGSNSNNLNHHSMHRLREIKVVNETLAIVEDEGMIGGTIERIGETGIEATDRGLLGRTHKVVGVTNNLGGTVHRAQTLDGTVQLQTHTTPLKQQAVGSFWTSAASQSPSRKYRSNYLLVL